MLPNILHAHLQLLSLQHVPSLYLPLLPHTMHQTALRSAPASADLSSTITSCANTARLPPGQEPGRLALVTPPSSIFHNLGSSQSPWCNQELNTSPLLALQTPIHPLDFDTRSVTLSHLLALYLGAATRSQKEAWQPPLGTELCSIPVVATEQPRLPPAQAELLPQ